MMETKFFNQNDQDQERILNKKKYVLTYVESERDKSNPRDTVADEFTEKCIIYGYIMVFHC